MVGWVDCTLSSAIHIMKKFQENEVAQTVSNTYMHTTNLTVVLVRSTRTEYFVYFFPVQQ